MKNLKTVFMAGSIGALFFISTGSGTTICRADILYVGNYDPNAGSEIEEFTSDGVGSVFASVGVHGPTGLAFDSADNLYVDNYLSDLSHGDGSVNLVKFTPEGVGSVFGTGAGFGIAFDSGGNLYEAVNGNIVKFNPAGVSSVFATVPNGYLKGLAFDSAGNLYVSDQDGNAIDKYTADGVGTVFARVGNPQGLAFDSEGNLYAASNDGIEMFTPSGVGSLFATTGGFVNGIAFDSAGNLYAADADNNTIEKFTPNGIGSVFVNAGSYDPLYLAFTTDSGVPLPLANQLGFTPEPTSLFLLASILAPLLLRHRNRRRNGEA